MLSFMQTLFASLQHKNTQPAPSTHFALFETTAAATTPYSYQSRIRDGYMRNPIAYRCIRMIAEAAATVPWTLYENEREHDSHPLLSLLAAPQATCSGKALMEQFYTYLQLSGNSYLEAIIVDEQIRELHVLRPDRLTIVTDQNGRHGAYLYKIGDTQRRFDHNAKPIPALFHSTLLNPLDDHYGLSPIAAAATAIDIHNAAGTWNKALLDNAARPSGALVYRGDNGSQNLPVDQFERLKKELENLHQGSQNAGRPLLLEGGLDWKPMALSPRDMDFNECRNAAARDIALAFGVPPMLLGIPGDNTYANYAEANRVLWRQTILPLINRTAQDLSQWLAPAFGAKLELGYDADQIEALHDERCALWQRIAAADFLTINEKRAAIGYGHVSDPDADRLKSSIP